MCDNARSADTLLSAAGVARASGPEAPVQRKSLAQKFRLAMRLTGRDWIDLGTATFALLRARIIFARLSSKELVGRLKSTQAGSVCAGGGESSPDNETAKLLRRLEWSIATAANNVPWRSDCLLRCLVADEQLRKRGLAPEFFIGVNKGPDGALVAHAWIRCQGVPVAGGDGTGFEVLIGPGRQ